MASSGKKRTTMAKLMRESRLRERRLDKQARKEARKLAPAHDQDYAGEPVDPAGDTVDRASDTVDPAGDGVDPARDTGEGAGDAVDPASGEPRRAGAGEPKLETVVQVLADR
jgi:hypothetical protein